MQVGEIVGMVGLICSALAAILSFIAQFVTGKAKKSLERWHEITMRIQELCVEWEKRYDDTINAGGEKRDRVIECLNEEYNLSQTETAHAKEFIDNFIAKTKQINFTETAERG